MLPFMAIMGAGMQFAGGILQAGEITRATEERMRQMRLKGAQEVGAYTAAVGGTGVEATSSTIQNHLNRMKVEIDTQVRNVGLAGQAAANNSIIGSGAGAISTIAEGFYKANQVSKAIGEKPADKGSGGSGISPVLAAIPDVKLLKSEWWGY